MPVASQNRESFVVAIDQAGVSVGVGAHATDTNKDNWLLLFRVKRDLDDAILFSMSPAGVELFDNANATNLRARLAVTSVALQFLLDPTNYAARPLLRIENRLEKEKKICRNLLQSSFDEQTQTLRASVILQVSGSREVFETMLRLYTVTPAAAAAAK
jgi:hypothetical protein